MTAPAEAPAASTDSTKRSRLYFGWYIVGGAFLAQMLQAGLSVYAGGVFLVPMTEDLGWSRTEFTLAQTVGQVVTGAIGFFIGAHVDRRGGRGVMVVGGVLVASTLFAIGYIEEWWQWLVLRGLLFMAGSAMIGNLVVNVTLSKWFVDLRGRAIGLGAVGFSIGGIVIAPPLTAFVDEFGWRAGWQVLAVVVVIIIFPVCTALPSPAGGPRPQPGRAERRRNAPRRRIEDRGRLPQLLHAPRGAAHAGPLHDHVCLRAGRDRHRRGDPEHDPVPHGPGLQPRHCRADRRLPRLRERLLEAVLGLDDGALRCPLCRAFGFALSGSVDGLRGVRRRVRSAPLVALAYVLWGTGVGALFPTQEVIWAQYFGRRYLGEVRSVVLPVSLGMGAAGPLITALYFDAVGDYDGVFLAVGINWVFASMLILAVRRPGPPPRIAITSPVTPQV